jgi:hypothetical protein
MLHHQFRHFTLPPATVTEITLSLMKCGGSHLGATIPQPIRHVAICIEVEVFPQGVEMGHVPMVDRYIFTKYSELFKINALRGNMEAMKNAWVFLINGSRRRILSKDLY